jgi:4-diphosphocytidyl-2-C-methyl-D-erythritol kinase
MGDSSLSLKAPAKINWFLKVLGLRNDGFHEIQSLIQKITLYDVLTFTPSKDLVLKMDVQIPIDQNLVYKAAMILKERYGIKESAMIYIEKNIPIGAGLGGGSSDAATALLGLNELWSLGLSTRALCEVAEEIGSDVPFFLHGSLSFVQGRGEKITSRKALKPLSILLVKPSFSVSTKWVYKNLSTRRFSVNEIDKKESKLTKKPNKVNNIEHLIKNIERAELYNIAKVIYNDLESVTIKSFPVIAEIKERLLKHGAILSLMSGSGPTVFGVFESEIQAKDASEAFEDYWTAVVQTII